MTTSRISESHKRAMRVRRISHRSYLGISLDCREIYTSEGTLVFQDGTWHRAPVDAGPTVGRNETGHKLPSSPVERV